MSELPIFMARYLSVSKFFAILLKCLLRTCASYSNLYHSKFKVQNRFFVGGLLREKLTESFPKYSMIRNNYKVSSFSKKFSLTFAKHADTKIYLTTKMVFKFFSSNFNLFITTLLSFFVIKLNLFERMYFIFWSVLEDMLKMFLETCYRHFKMNTCLQSRLTLQTRAIYNLCIT